MHQGHDPNFAGLGSLIRSQLAAVIAIFAMAFGVEQIVGGVSRSAAVYLPFVSASTMAGGTRYSMPPLPIGLTPLPFVGVAALLVVIAWLISTVAAHTTIQRDIT